MPRKFSLYYVSQECREAKTGNSNENNPVSQVELAASVASLLAYARKRQCRSTASLGTSRGLREDQAHRRRHIRRCLYAPHYPAIHR